MKEVHSGKIDADKFYSLKVAIQEFSLINNRRMSLEELKEHCKMEFEDMSFIETLINYCRDQDQPESPDKKQSGAYLENHYTAYVS